MIRRLFKTIGISIACFLGLLVAAYGVLVLLSLEKAPLHPEVEAFLRPEPISVAAERNGFYFWIGLNAPAGEDPIQYGERVIAELRLRSPVSEAATAARAQNELRLVSYDRNLVCSPENREPCLAFAKRNAAQVRDLARLNAELLRRFEALLRSEEFATDMPLLGPSDLLPGRQDQMSLFALAWTLDAADFAEGRLSEALERLVARVAFLRRMHANSSALIDRVIAQALIARDLNFLAEVAVAEPEAAKAAAAQVAVIAAPITASERSPFRWLRHEFAQKFAAIDPGNSHAWRYSVCEAVVQAGMLELAMSDKVDERCGRWDIRMLALAGAPLMDRNALANQRYEAIRQLRRIDAPDTFSYLARFREIVAGVESRRRAEPKWRLRNPFGEWMAARVNTDLVADATMYHLSALDQDRLFALTRLAVGLVRDPVRQEEIAAYLKRPGVLDPATREPFGWDSARSQVFFIPLDPWIAARGRVGGIDGRVGLALHR